MSKSDLKSVIEKFKGTPVVVAGDLILDHYIWGNVNRISPEAPVVVVEMTEESKRLGGAGNVAHNLAALGARPLICGIVGNDEAGTAISTMFNYLNADVEGIIEDSSRPTTVKTRVIAHAQQVVRVDREITSSIDGSLGEKLASTFEAKVKQAKAVIISDYAKGCIVPSLFDRVERLRNEGIIGWRRVPVLVDPKAPNFKLYKSSTVIKPNRKEAEEAAQMRISNRAEALEAGRSLIKKWKSEMVLITLGEHGMALVSDVPGEETTVEVDTVARDVFDVSGAGDTVSAVFSLSLAVGATPRQAAQLANFAAGIVVAEVGTVAVSSAELLNAVEKSGGV